MRGMSAFRLLCLGSPAHLCRGAAMLAVLVVACGGQSQNPPGGGSGSGSGGGSGGGSGSGGSSGSSSGGGSTGCPPSQPMSNITCAAQATPLTCEYGGDQDLQCDALWTCANGVWSFDDMASMGGVVCPTSQPG